MTSDDSPNQHPHTGRTSVHTLGHTLGPWAMGLEAWGWMESSSEGGGCFAIGKKLDFQRKHQELGVYDDSPKPTYIRIPLDTHLSIRRESRSSF